MCVVCVWILLNSVQLFIHSERLGMHLGGRRCGNDFQQHLLEHQSAVSKWTRAECAPGNKHQGEKWAKLFMMISSFAIFLSSVIVFHGANVTPILELRFLNNLLKFLISPAVMLSQ